LIIDNLRFEKEKMIWNESIIIPTLRRTPLPSSLIFTLTGITADSSPESQFLCRPRYDPTTVKNNTYSGKRKMIVKSLQESTGGAYSFKQNFLLKTGS
jgi:hypothetical protein